MNPGILARIFAAQQQPQRSPLTLEQDAGPLQWGTGDPRAHSMIDLGQPQGDPGARESRMQSIDDSVMPPSDYKYLDRVEGDEHPLGVMFGQEAGEPMGHPQNVPMGRLPPGAQEGTYISPLDIHGRRHAPAPMRPQGSDGDGDEGVTWGPNPYPAPFRGGRMTSR